MAVLIPLQFKPLYVIIERSPESAHVLHLRDLQRK